MRHISPPYSILAVASKDEIFFQHVTEQTIDT